MMLQLPLQMILILRYANQLKPIIEKNVYFTLEYEKVFPSCIILSETKFFVTLTVDPCYLVISANTLFLAKH